MKKVSKLLWLGLIVFPILGCFFVWLGLSQGDAGVLFVSLVLFGLTILVYLAIRDPEGGDERTRAALGSMITPAMLLALTVNCSIRAYSQQSGWQLALAVLFGLAFVFFVRAMRRQEANESLPRQ